MSINCRKIGYTIFCILVSIQIGYSQDSLSVFGKYENDNVVHRNDTFLLNNNYRFFITDANGNKKDLNSCVWRFECLSEDSTYIIDREQNSNEFNFTLDDLHVKSSLLKRINANDNISVLFQARISCSGHINLGENFYLSFPVYLNLLPAIPEVNILDYIYDNNNIFIKLNVFSERAEKYQLVTKEYDYPLVNTLVSQSSWPEFKCLIIESDSIEIYAYGINNFGISNYRKFKFIYADLPTGLNEINNESALFFYPNPFSDVIYMRGKYGDIDKLIITDVNGKAIKIINKIESPAIQVANLPKGMYLITVSQKHDSRNKSFKLLKK